MTTTAEKIAALETAMASGTLEVSYDGKRVRYASQAEMERAIAYFRAQQRQAAGQGAVNVSVGAIFRD